MVPVESVGLSWQAAEKVEPIPFTKGSHAAERPSEILSRRALAIWAGWIRTEAIELA